MYVNACLLFFFHKLAPVLIKIVELVLNSFFRLFRFVRFVRQLPHFVAGSLEPLQVVVAEEGADGAADAVAGGGLHVYFIHIFH